MSPAAPALRALGLARAVADAWAAAAGGGPGALAPPLLDGRADALAEAVEEALWTDAPPAVVDVDVDEVDALARVEAALAAGAPAVLRRGAARWRCVRAWAAADGTPDWPAFGAAFRGEEGRVTDCEARDVRVKCGVSAYAAAQAAADPASRSLYLKDVQFAQASPPDMLEDASFPCSTPSVDWLSHAAAAAGRARAAASAPPLPSYRFIYAGPAATATPLPSYRFIYAGPAATATPLHCDVYGSAAWSANAAGVKAWTFVAAGDAPRLYDRWGAGAARWLDGRGEGGGWGDGAASPITHPWLAGAAARAQTVTQRAGDVVFVPGGVWHAVENVTPTISLNVNFIDASCARAAAAAVVAEHAAADGVPTAPAPARQVDGSSLASGDGIGVDGFADVALAAAARDVAAIEAGKAGAATRASAAAAADVLAALAAYARSGGAHAAVLNAAELEAGAAAARRAGGEGRED